MLLKPCPFCQKDIPRAMNVCPYCHRDEQGQSVQMDSTAPAPEPVNSKYFENDLAELASEDPFQREQAVVRMAQKGFGVVQALVSILSDHAKPGLASVAKVLGRVKDRRAIPALTQAAKLGDDELRMAAVWALTQFREPEVLPVLLTEAERPHPVIQSYLAYVLGSYQDARVISVLSRLARHENREVAFHAAQALGETGDSAAISGLRRAGQRRDPLIQQAAAAALRRLGARVTSNRRIIFYAVSAIVTAIIVILVLMKY